VTGLSRAQRQHPPSMPESMTSYTQPALATDVLPRVISTTRAVFRLAVHRLTLPSIFTPVATVFFET
jgi:hypothetical protein